MAFQSSSADADEMITDINVTPFVDVVLVLLIIFMLAAPAVYQAALPVHLPKVQAETHVQHVTLHFYVTEAGQVIMDKETLDSQAVQARVKKALSYDPAADAMISADKKVSHGVVMELLGTIRKNGIKEVAMAVEEG